MLENILFDANNVLGILITAPLTYAATIAFIRISGKRSTSQMNNFDWIVTVSIGSIIASGIISDDVSVLESVVAMGVLLLLQFLLTKGVFLNKELSELVKPQPTLLLYEGQYLKDAMQKERVTESEIVTAIRSKGQHDVNTVYAVILEQDASLSVLPKPELDISNSNTLAGVAGIPTKNAKS